MGGEELITGEAQDLSLPSGQEEKIQVLVRLRPLNDKEIARNDVSDWECINNTTIIFKNSLPERSMFPAAYTVDRVFGYGCPTREVYEEGAKEVSLSVVSGINSSIFAYGPTSSGKTYTMRGVTEYAISDIYDYIEKHKEREFVLKFAAMEIYNEVVRDLISDTSPLRLLDDPERGTVVERLTEETLRDKSHLQELLAICESQRQVGETSLNETSSRSHQILRLTIESSAREYIGADKSTTLTATVNFVDLAGSERASQTHSAGVRLKEGSHINRSLLTLGKVVRTLSKGRNTHVPYRDSKLTRILQNSLGGNARTAIICTMSPARSQIEQSRNTLLFASCAKEISTNAQVNVVMSDKALVKKLQRELARLESEMKKLGSGTDVSTTLLEEKELIIEQMEKEIKELTRQRDLGELRIENLLQSSINEKIEGKVFPHGPGGTEGTVSDAEATDDTDEDALSSVSLQGGLEQEGKGEFAMSSVRKKDKDSSPASKDPIYDALRQKIQELQRTIHYLVNLHPQEETPEADVDVSKSAKLNRSASCRAILMSNPYSLGFKKAEHGENTRPNWSEENFAGRTGGFYRRLSEIKFGKFSRKDSQTSISGVSMESFKDSDADDTTSSYEHNENTLSPWSEKAGHKPTDWPAKSFLGGPAGNLVPGQTDLVQKVAMNNVKDAGLKKGEVAVHQVSTWPAEFESRRKEIIELWDACNVPLMHRTYFYLLFQGDPSDSVYMEVELRRLSFLQAGKVSKESLNASLKALHREREALSKQIHQKFSRKEREELYQRWDIKLNTKQRSLQLARRIWSNTKDMNHVQESAALVAKLVGFLNSGLAPKEMFGLSFLAESINKRSFSWRHTKSSASLLTKSNSLLL